MKYKLIVFDVFLTLCSLGNLWAQSVSTPKRSVTKISEGIYVIRHKDAPDGNPQGNTSVIIGKKKVIVVDAPYLPSAAREDIDLIRKLTDKPVDYLINTHWHADHQQGDPEYVKAFPHVTIIAHQQTANEIIAFENKDMLRYRQNLDSLREKIQKGKNDDGHSFSAEELSDLKQLLIGQDSVEQELKNDVPVFPDLTINSGVNLDIGVQVVQVIYLGAVHTRGDIMAYLPDQKLLIAGDVIVSPVPYFFGGGYPYSGLKVLQAINQMDIGIIVPGHGEILKGKVYLNQEIDLLKNVISKVEAEVYRQGLLGIKLENIQKAIDLNLFRKQFSRGNKENEDFFDESISRGLVEGCFNEMPK